MDPRAAAERPEEARTDSSEASSMSLRMCVTDLKTPGSMGGGVALPGLGEGNGGGGGNCANVLRGESGGEWSPRLAKPCRRRAGRVTELAVGGGSAGRRVSVEDCNEAGSKLMTSRDSRSSTGSCSQGPYTCKKRYKSNKLAQRRRTYVIGANVSPVLIAANAEHGWTLPSSVRIFALRRGLLRLYRLLGLLFLLLFRSARLFFKNGGLNYGRGRR